MEDAETHLDGSVHRRGDSASSVSGASVAARPLVFLHGVGLGLVRFYPLPAQDTMELASPENKRNNPWDGGIGCLCLERIIAAFCRVERCWWVQETSCIAHQASFVPTPVFTLRMMRSCRTWACSCKSAALAPGPP